MNCHQLQTLLLSKAQHKRSVNCRNEWLGKLTNTYSSGPLNQKCRMPGDSQPSTLCHSWTNPFSSKKAKKKSDSAFQSFNKKWTQGDRLYRVSVARCWRMHEERPGLLHARHGWFQRVSASSNRPITGHSSDHQPSWRHL